MNESCPECGGKVSGCKWDKSHGMDFDSENKHLDEDKKANELTCEDVGCECVSDKAWGEFEKWCAEANGDNYHFGNNFEQIGLLIEYLKTKANLKDPDEIIHFSNINVEYLEKEVKSLKPVDEVEEIKELLFEEGGISIWSEVKMRDLARKAIEIIKGK